LLVHLKISLKKKQNSPKSSNFIDHNIFSSHHTLKLIEHPLYLSTLTLNPYLYANLGLKKTTTKGVSHCGLAMPFTTKKYLKAKEEL